MCPICHSLTAGMDAHSYCLGQDHTENSVQQLTACIECQALSQMWQRQQWVHFHYFNMSLCFLPDCPECDTTAWGIFYLDDLIVMAQRLGYVPHSSVNLASIQVGEYNHLLKAQPLASPTGRIIVGHAWFRQSLGRSVLTKMDILQQRWQWGATLMQALGLMAATHSVVPVELLHVQWQQMFFSSNHLDAWLV